MEMEGVKPEDKARKRRRKDAPERKYGVFVGRYVRKEFPGFEGVFLGKVVSFEEEWYKVSYEDGDSEELDTEEVSEIAVMESNFDEGMIEKKKMLDRMLSKNGTKKRKVVTFVEPVDGKKAPSAKKLSSNKKLGLEPNEKRPVVVKTADPLVNGSSSDCELGLEYGEKKHVLDETEAPLDTSLKSDGELGFETDQKLSADEADSSSDSCEYGRVGESCSVNEVVPLIPAPELPPSSNNVGVPEDLVSHLFSVYTFLRSFSIQLFLSPFLLDDFVGSLNCGASNNLINDIHLALFRALRRHLEMLSFNGALPASKCLRRLDWSLLDTFTWQAYLVEYLLIMGCTKGPDWRGIYINIIDSEYYSLSVAKKLMILQILCDSVIESAELRAEIDRREISEEGSMSDETSTPLPSENGPRRVHPRCTKTSAIKDIKTPEVVTEPHSGLSKLDVNAAADIDQDSNSDECRLCGMDGILLCCDGCPSAYHSRCIGLSKALVPEGSWFCPECTINKADLSLRIGTGLRGSEIFGIDPYEQVFLGICNHLLVLKASTTAGPSSRYYNQNDVVKVLQLLSSSIQFTTLYADIRNGISQYWQIMTDTNISLSKSTDAATYPEDRKEIKKPIDKTGRETYASSITETNMENGVQLCQTNDRLEVGLNCNTSLDTVNQGSVPCIQNDSGALMDAKSLGQLGTESIISTGSVSHHPDHFVLTRQSFCSHAQTFANLSSSNGKVADRTPLPTSSGALSIYREVGEGKINKNEKFSYTGSLFKPHAYVNQYIHGDIAASAAADLAFLGSDPVSKAQTSSNTKKFVSANIAVQVKAFSVASIRFFWPISEKRLMEVPKERCGWCLSCRAPSSSRRGCYLNSAASNAIKRCGKIPRPIKNAAGRLQGIASYILYMEEILGCLVVGPFLTVAYRKQWRAQVVKASTCSAIKYLLLELEEHIRIIIFSGGWVKLVDEWSFEAPMAPIGASATGSTSKRSSSKRTRKQPAKTETAADTCDEELKTIRWSRGGEISKLVFHKGVLPHSLVRKGARQGGSRKIAGIYYSEGPEIPRRTRRLSWRAAVEMCKNAQQLALQRLDFVSLIMIMIRSMSVKIDEWLAKPAITCVEYKIVLAEYKCFLGEAEEELEILAIRPQEENNEDEGDHDRGREVAGYHVRKRNEAKIKNYDSHRKIHQVAEIEVGGGDEGDRKEEEKVNENDKEVGTSIDTMDMRMASMKVRYLDVHIRWSDLVRSDQNSHDLKGLDTETSSFRNALICDKMISDNKIVYELNFGDQKHLPSRILKNRIEVEKNGDGKDKFWLSETHIPLYLIKEYEEKANMVPPLLPVKAPQVLSELQRRQIKAWRKDIFLYLQLKGENGNKRTCASCQKLVILREAVKCNDCEGYCHKECTIGAFNSRLTCNECHAKAFALSEQRRLQNQMIVKQNQMVVKQNQMVVKQNSYRQPLISVGKRDASVSNSTIKAKAKMSPHGLIWKDENNEDTGVNFRFSNILLRGNPDMEPSRKPVCKLCNNPYNSNLMYICCGICQGWYHADAVELKEPQVFNVAGLSCLKCQKKPFTCPYKYSEPEFAMLPLRSSRQGNLIRDPRYDSNFSGGWESTTPMIQIEDRNFFSLEKVEPITGYPLESGIEWGDAVSGAFSKGPQKLPVRRQVKREKEADGSSIPSNIEPELLTEAKTPPLPLAEWEYSVDFSGEGINFEGIRFDANELFSVEELLGTCDDNNNNQLDENIQLDPFDGYIDMSEMWDSSLNFEQNAMGGMNDDQALMVPAEPSEISCQRCAHTEPLPDRCCEVCGYRIHSHCSPWIEPCKEERWRCGCCRGQQ
ncbi:hypothetical protein GIB67_034088 [Kingdonia uniflora]|uniref:Uncharacterized protein n=1 Tax=Kingdonia uniflora TaxID=39325 RepID=A0A7J7M678_9MAGN|nr:hypothetical protein GIB67_034088 [Kingdonia uniflora]